MFAKKIKSKAGIQLEISITKILEKKLGGRVWYDAVAFEAETGEKVRAFREEVLEQFDLKGWLQAVEKELASHGVKEGSLDESILKELGYLENS